MEKKLGKIGKGVKNGFNFGSAIFAAIFWAGIVAILFVDAAKGHYVSAIKAGAGIILFVGVFAVLFVLANKDKRKKEK